MTSSSFGASAKDGSSRSRRAASPFFAALSRFHFAAMRSLASRSRASKPRRAKFATNSAPSMVPLPSLSNSW